MVTYVILGASGTVALTAFMLLWWLNARKARKHIIRLTAREEFYRNKANRLNKENAELTVAYRDMRDRIHAVAQAEAKRIVSEWEPDPKLTEAEFRKAEYMANQREMRDAERKTMPRSDQIGVPAVVRNVLKKRK